jgi:hypothetical protein
VSSFLRSASGEGATTSISVTFVDDFTDGALLCVGATARETITGVTETTGTLIVTKVCGTQDTFGPTTWGEIWYIPRVSQVFSGPAGVFVIGGTTATKSAVMVEFANSLAGSDGDFTTVDGTHTGTNFSVNADSGVTPATAHAVDVSFASIGQEPNNHTVAWNAPFASLATAGLSSCSTAVAFRDMAATGTTQATGTCSGGASVVWVACVANFKLAGGAAPEPVFRRMSWSQEARLRR